MALVSDDRSGNLKVETMSPGLDTVTGAGAITAAAACRRWRPGRTESLSRRRDSARTPWPARMPAAAPDTARRDWLNESMMARDLNPLSRASCRPLAGWSRVDFASESRPGGGGSAAAVTERNLNHVM